MSDEAKSEDRLSLWLVLQSSNWDR